MMFHNGLCMYDELGGCIKVDGCQLGGAIQFVVYISIGYIMPTIGGNVDKLVGVFGPFGPWLVGLVCQLLFTLILYTFCQQLGGCI